MEKQHGFVSVDGGLIEERRDAPRRPLLALETDAESDAGLDSPGAVTCGACHYANRVSQAFFILSVQNLYCRRCGKMIDRHGKPARSS